MAKRIEDLSSTQVAPGQTPPQGISDSRGTPEQRRARELQEQIKTSESSLRVFERQARRAKAIINKPLKHDQRQIAQARKDLSAAERGHANTQKIIASAQKELASLTGGASSAGGGFSSGVVTPEEALRRGKRSPVTPEDIGLGATFGAGGAASDAAGGVGSGGSGGGGAAPVSGGVPTTSDQDIIAFIEENYPQYAWLVANPDIRTLFQRAMSEDWADNKLLLELRKTEWYRTTSESVRQWEALKATDPATAGQRMQQQAALLHDSAARLGVDISADAFGRLVENSLRFGWVPEQVDDALVNFATFTGGTSAGALQRVKGLASDYGVLMGEQVQKDWARRLLLGEVDEEGLVADFVERAKSLYAPDGKGFVASGLDAGRTVRQIMDGYIQIAAQDLELNPEAIDITDTKWSRPLLQVDAEGNRTPLSLYDWRQLIRSDDTYGFKGTKQAEDKAEAFALSLAQTFGAVA